MVYYNLKSKLGKQSPMIKEGFFSSDCEVEAIDL